MPVERLDAKETLYLIPRVAGQAPPSPRWLRWRHGSMINETGQVVRDGTVAAHRHNDTARTGCWPAEPLPARPEVVCRLWRHQGDGAHFGPRNDMAAQEVISALR